MKLYDLIKQAQDIARKHNNNQLPIYMDGWEIDFRLQDIYVDGQFRVALLTQKKPDTPRELRIRKEIAVRPENYAVLCDLLKENILIGMIADMGATSKITIKMRSGELQIGGWIVQLENGEWCTLPDEYHKKLLQLGKLIMVEDGQ